MPVNDIMTDIEPYLLPGGLAIALAVLLVLTLVMLGLFVELRRTRRASENIGMRLHTLGKQPGRAASSHDPIRFAAAALLATRPERNVSSDEFAREFEDLLSDWQHLDSRITELLDRIDGQEHERKL